MARVPYAPIYAPNSLVRIGGLVLDSPGLLSDHLQQFLGREFNGSARVMAHSHLMVDRDQPHYSTHIQVWPRLKQLLYGLQAMLSPMAYKVLVHGFCEPVAAAFGAPCGVAALSLNPASH